MLNQKVRDEEIPPDLPGLLFKLEDEERRMKQATKFNPAQSQGTSSGFSNPLRGGLNSRGDHLDPVEVEMVVQWEAQVVQLEAQQVDRLQVRLRGIRTTHDATPTISTTHPENVSTQTSNAMSAEKRDTHSGIVPEEVKLVVNKARIPHHPT